MPEMTLEILPQLILNGVIAGSFYALLALGLALIYGVMDIQSFAHGGIAVLGAYFYWTLHNMLGWNALASLAIALPGVVLVGLILEYVLFLRIKDVNPLVSLVSTVGVGIVLKNLTIMIWSQIGRASC